MVTRIAFLYFGFMAWGCLALLPVVKLQEIGQGFYRFIGFLCVALQTVAVGLAFMMGPDAGADQLKAAYLLGTSLLFTLAFTIALRIRVRWFLWSCYDLAFLSGAAAVFYFPWAGSGNRIFMTAHAFSSSLVLGAGILSMLIGHWYLVTPKLSLAPLKRYGGGYILLTAWMALQLALAYWAFVGFGPQIATPAGILLARNEVVFTLFRTAWGSAVPLAFAYFIWTTIKMGSTQSATGMLYASLVCTMIGEGMGLYLTLATGVPF